MRTRHRRAAARFLPAAWGLAAAATLFATGCVRAPSEGVGVDQLGSIEAAVVDDKSGAPVLHATVYVQQRSGSQLVQAQTAEVSNIGTVRFDALQAATMQIWAVPPEGYTGGGDTHAKTITVIGGQIIQVTLTLTKL